MRHLPLYLALVALPAVAASKHPPGPYDLCIKQGGTFETCKQHLPPRSDVEAIKRDAAATAERSKSYGNRPGVSTPPSPPPVAPKR